MCAEQLARSPWGADRALYVGNVMTNGDFVRVALMAGTSSQVATFPARVTAATPFDLHELLVALEGGQVDRFDIVTNAITPWTNFGSDVTSLARDGFTGNIFAELNATPPTIVAMTSSGASLGVFQMPPRLGRIAISPDGVLYHLSAYPAVDWMEGNAIVNWPLPSTR